MMRAGTEKEIKQIPFQSRLPWHMPYLFLSNRWAMNVYMDESWNMANCSFQTDCNFSLILLTRSKNMNSSLHSSNYTPQDPTISSVPCHSGELFYKHMLYTTSSNASQRSKVKSAMMKASKSIVFLSETGIK